MDGLELMETKVDSAPDSQEMIDEMWAEFDGQAEKMRITHRDFMPGNWDLDDEYDQITFLSGGYEKDYSGMNNDWRTRKTIEEFEYWIEDVVGERRIREGKFKMYKGQVKKW